MTTDAEARPRHDRTPAWQLWLAFALVFTLCAAVSIQQHRRMETLVFDLGFLEAILHDLAQGQLPIVSYTDSVVAPLHFTPALLALVPLVMVWPSPVVLLLAQAGLVAIGVVPLMRVAAPGLMAWVVVISYGLAPGFASLIGFDVHDVTMGVPLIAFSMAAMVRGDHRAAVLWALPLLLVKEDLGLTVAALGLVVFLRGSRRWGLVAMVVGLVTTVVVYVWVLPALQPDGSLAEVLEFPTTVGDAVRALSDGASNKIRTVLYLLVPTGFLVLRRPTLLIVALPTFGWRFVSTRYTHWDPWYHYDAILVAIAVAAMIEGATALRGRVRTAGLVLAVVGTLVVVPRFPFAQVWQPDFWSGAYAQRSAAVDRVLDRIPDDAVVAASDTLGARIALRTELYTMGCTCEYDGPALPPSDFDDVEWIAVDAHSWVPQVPGWKGFAELLQTGDFRVVAEDAGVVVARRIAPSTGE